MYLALNIIKSREYSKAPVPRRRKGTWFEGAAWALQLRAFYLIMGSGLGGFFRMGFLRLIFHFFDKFT